MFWTVVYLIAAFVSLVFAIRACNYKKFGLVGLCLSFLFLYILIPSVHLFYERFHISRSEIDITAKKPIEPALFTSQHKVPGRVFVTQEYPNAQEHNYQESIDLRSHSAVMKWQNSEQSFWLGIGNLGNTNFSNPTLFLHFSGKVEVKFDATKSRGWTEIDPNISYVYSAKGILQPSVLTRLNPLLVKFPKEGIYEAKCTVTGDNTPPITADFKIDVRK
ncbi:MAG: hypothetical protein AB1401_03465 [Thermodesulfobacteriota bacterium]